MVRLRKTNKEKPWASGDTRILRWSHWYKRNWWMMNVELEMLPIWLLMWDFTSKGLEYVRESTIGIIACMLTWGKGASMGPVWYWQPRYLRFLRGTQTWVIRQIPLRGASIGGRWVLSIPKLDCLTNSHLKNSVKSKFFHILTGNSNKWRQVHVKKKSKQIKLYTSTIQWPIVSIPISKWRNGDIRKRDMTKNKTKTQGGKY